jgi:hypothetical protein
MARTIDIIPTGVPHTSAAHLVASGDEITIVWSTIPVPCDDWLLGDITSQHPVHYPDDKVPDVWQYNGFDWMPLTEVQCGTCGQRVGPWALVRDGHLTDDELTEVAQEVAELANDEYEYQQDKLIAFLTEDAEDTVRHLAEGILTRDELPIIGTTEMPGVVLDCDEVVAWSVTFDKNGHDDFVEVVRPITSD